MDWKKIGEKTVFQGWRSIIEKRFFLPNGKESSFDVLSNADYVTIAAFTKDQEVILVKQYRPGPETSLISFPEGGLENGEQLEKAAARELLEETGYQAENITYLKTFQSAYSTQQQICVVAVNCEKVDEQKLDETEFIEVILLPVQNLRSFLTNSQNDSFTNVGAAYLALDYLGLL